MSALNRRRPRLDPATARDPPGLLARLRERIRYPHYSLRTEQAYVYWARAFVRYHGMRHPRDLGRFEVERFLAHLANEGHVSVLTHKQALCALLFLYREVLGEELPWMQDLGRPKSRVRVPTVLSREPPQPPPIPARTTPDRSHRFGTTSDE